jgi:hypothetical protein
MEVLRLAVLDQQEARAKAYADFEAGYVSYLGGGSDEEYEALCKSVTGRFAAASEEIKKSEAEIMKGGEEKLCGCDTPAASVPSLQPALQSCPFLSALTQSRSTWMDGTG